MAIFLYFLAIRRNFHPRGYVKIYPHNSEHTVVTSINYGKKLEYPVGLPRRRQRRRKQSVQYRLNCLTILYKINISLASEAEGKNERKKKGLLVTE